MLHNRIFDFRPWLNLFRIDQEPSVASCVSQILIKLVFGFGSYVSCSAKADEYLLHGVFLHFSTGNLTAVCPAWSYDFHSAFLQRNTQQIVGNMCVLFGQFGCKNCLFTPKILPGNPVGPQGNDQWSAQPKKFACRAEGSEAAVGTILSAIKPAQSAVELSRYTEYKSSSTSASNSSVILPMSFVFELKNHQMQERKARYARGRYMDIAPRSRKDK